MHETEATITTSRRSKAPAALRTKTAGRPRISWIAPEGTAPRAAAARLGEAKQTIPHFYLRRDIQLDALMAFRGQLNAQLEGRGVKLSVNDFIIKACANALQQVPDANAVLAGGRILKLKPSDVAVAVAGHDEHGQFVAYGFQAGGHGRGPAVRGLEHVEVEVLVCKDRAADRANPDGG